MASLSIQVNTIKTSATNIEIEAKVLIEEEGFEKVKIPETKANIKKISVSLGDEQVAAVVRSKISKKKLQAVAESKKEVSE